MFDEDQIGTPLTRRAPPWFTVGCGALVLLAVVYAVFALARRG